MKSEEFRKNGHVLIDWMADYMDSVENFDVRSQVNPGDILSLLDDEPPLDGAVSYTHLTLPTNREV